MSDKVDTNICPLCHQVNQCDVNNSAGCWCMNTEIPKPLLAKVPTEYKSLRCICNNCITKYQRQQAIEAVSEQTK